MKVMDEGGGLSEKGRSRDIDGSSTRLNAIRLAEKVTDNQVASRESEISKVTKNAFIKCGKPTSMLLKLPILPPINGLCKPDPEPLPPLC